MRDGFFRTAGAVPAIRVADPDYNTERILSCLKKAEEAGAKLVVFPELAITGYTCQDLFLQDALLAGAEAGLARILEATRGSDTLILVGFPYRRGACLYNTAAAVQGGKLLALIPKRFLPTYGEFYETRQFTAGPEEVENVTLLGQEVPFGSRILLDVDAIPGLSIGAEICEDAWVPNAPDVALALAGGTILANLSASNETVGKDAYRTNLVTNLSGRTITGYVYVSSGDGESTQDIVFGGRVLLAENGSILGERKIFDNGWNEDKLCCADFDIARLLYERRRMSTFAGQETAPRMVHVSVHMERKMTPITRTFPRHPFVPAGKADRDERCRDIIQIQSRGLAKRLTHIGCQSAVIGVSGGLDSTLALLVTARAFDLAGIERKKILAVTMPCFGTTDRTYQNAIHLAEELGAALKEVNIKAAVTQHFSDIGQDMEVHDVTYENGQARERTQVLMDLANKTNGIVIGTGDLSELALGWATYNGDHMSMYGVNASVPKTLVRLLVAHVAQGEEDPVKAILEDVIATPVSPELLPAKADGTINQVTEDIVGPYELHDFFLYYLVRWGFSPRKIWRIARATFQDSYPEEVLRKWLKNFYKRFFQQQFKRSCLPDGPKVGSVALSPRGDWRMPSDASVALWMREIDLL